MKIWLAIITANCTLCSMGTSMGTRAFSYSIVRVWSGRKLVLWQPKLHVLKTLLNGRVSMETRNQNINYCYTYSETTSLSRPLGYVSWMALVSLILTSVRVHFLVAQRWLLYRRYYTIKTCYKISSGMRLNLMAMFPRFPGHTPVLCTLYLAE